MESITPIIVLTIVFFNAYYIAGRVKTLVALFYLGTDLYKKNKIKPTNISLMNNLSRIFVILVNVLCAYLLLVSITKSALHVVVILIVFPLMVGTREAYELKKSLRRQ